MRLFFYYAVHSFKNQLKKLFKTWVLLFFLICVVIGAGIGVGVAFLSENADENAPQTEEIASVPLHEKLGVETADILEAAACAVSLLVVFLCVMNSDKSGSKIFLPADVKLLFPSPLPPQSILMFRLSAQLGILLLSMFYLLFQLPNLILNAGLSLFAALSLLLGLVLCAMFGVLLQVLFYLLCSSHEKLKTNFHRLVYAFLVLVLLGYLFTVKRSGEGYLKAAILYANSPVSRFIPVFGWIKGFCGAAVRGNSLISLLFLLLCFAGIAALLLLIRHTKADYYEDAMQKSEETAAKLEAQSAKSTGVVRRKRDRSETLRRDGLSKGRGATVFFHKALYNRFRFAHFGFLTKTTEIYLVASAAVCALCRFAIHTESILPPVLLLSAFAFYRSLGNPLEQDTGMSFFALIPESCFRKLFYSMLGGCADCFLDLLPALILAGLLQGGNLFAALVWLPFILSVDIYATAVGCFINLSVPTSAGKTVKQFVQVLFVYFGLLPDAAILAFGILNAAAAPAAVASALLNLLLGLLFLGITPSVLIPGEKAARACFHASGSVTAAKKAYSRCGLAVFSVLIVSSVLQIVALQICVALNISLQGPAFWLAAFLPMYLVGFPVGIFILNSPERSRFETERFGVGRILALIPISMFLMYAGNLIGSAVTTLLGHIGIVSANPLEELVQLNDLLPQAIVTVLCAPVFEELIFRRLLLNRMRRYGEKSAVFLSALLFGLFHGNLSQFFYAFLLGLLLGYVYLRSGKVRLTVFLHMVINFLGGILPVLLLAGINTDVITAWESGDAEAALSAVTQPGIIAAGLFFLFVVAMFLLGMILFFVRLRRIHFLPAEDGLPKGKLLSAVVLNVGMPLAVLGCLVLMATSLLQT